MYTDTIGDVALTKISLETNYYHNFLQYLCKTKVLRLSSASGIFLACSYNIWAFLIKLFNLILFSRICPGHGMMRINTYHFISQGTIKAKFTLEAKTS